MFKRTDYSKPDNFAPVFNILTATTGESSKYNPTFEIYGNVIRTPLLDNIETEEELNQIAIKFANSNLPVWTMFNKKSKYFPVIFYKIPGLSYPFNVSESVSNINTGFLEEYIHQITTNENINLITNYELESETTPLGVIEFNYGIASGDPLATQVIIWTHAKYNNLDNDVYLKYEVSLDEIFSKIVKSEIVNTNKSIDFTLKVDVQGLYPNTTYYYRFININDKINTSPIGRTRTIPDLKTEVDSINLATVSCSQYTRGYFNVYQDIGRLDNINAVIHLGDYIYEYGIDGTYNNDGRPLSAPRIPNPIYECLTLDDYRKRHAQSKTDTDSQYMHSCHPIIPVWDDHEVSDNSWEFGAEYENPGLAYMIRKENAIKAYHEWMPIRTGIDPHIIFRTFDFGSILSLHMLDTRHYRRDKQVTIQELVTEPEKYREILYSPTRKLLGPSQLDWLTEQMIKSKNPWQVLGNQVIMAKTLLPVSILINVNNEVLLFESITNYLTALNTPPEFRTPEQNALLNPEINPLYGYNLDAWDGYPAEREKLYNIIEKLNKNVIVLSGDSHNSWFNYLTDDNNKLIGKELAVTSVTSTGIEAAFPNIPPIELQKLFETLFTDVKWIDTYRRGYLISTYTKEKVVADWKFIDNINNMYYSESKPSHLEIITTEPEPEP